MKRTLTALAVLGCFAALSACGSKKDNVNGAPGAAPLSLMLDYTPNADHAGIYTAQARGDFRKAGLNLKILVPGQTTSPLSALAAGRADLVITYEPELLLARDKGEPFVAVAALANRPLTALIALDPDKVSSAADLKGKTVGTAGIPYQAAYLKTIAQKAGIDPGSVKQVDVGFNLVPAMKSKRVDATLGGYWNYEGVEVKRDEKPRPTIIPVNDLGVPTYDELVVVGREKFLRDHGALVRRFVQGLQAGTRAVRADPQLGIKSLLAAAPSLKAVQEREALAATLPVLFPANTSKPFGWMDPSQWQKFSTWMLDNKLVKTLPTDRALTDEFLPGQGVVGDSGDVAPS